MAFASRAVFEGKTKLPNDFDVEESTENSESDEQFSLLKSSKNVYCEKSEGKEKLSAQVDPLSLKGTKVVVKDCAT